MILWLIYQWDLGQINFFDVFNGVDQVSNPFISLKDIKKKKNGIITTVYPTSVSSGIAPLHFKKGKFLRIW